MNDNSPEVYTPIHELTDYVNSIHELYKNLSPYALNLHRACGGNDKLLLYINSFKQVVKSSNPKSNNWETVTEIRPFNCGLD